MNRCMLYVDLFPSDSNLPLVRVRASWSPAQKGTLVLIFLDCRGLPVPSGFSRAISLEAPNRPVC